MDVPTRRRKKRRDWAAAAAAYDDSDLSTSTTTQRGGQFVATAPAAAAAAAAAARSSTRGHSSIVENEEDTPIHTYRNRSDNESTDDTVEDHIMIDEINNNDDHDAQRRHRRRRRIHFNSNYDNCSHSPPRPHTQLLLRRNGNDDMDDAENHTTTDNSRIGRGSGSGREVGLGIRQVDATEEERYTHIAESSFSSASPFPLGLRSRRPHNYYYSVSGPATVVPTDVFNVPIATSSADADDDEDVSPMQPQPPHGQTLFTHEGTDYAGDSDYRTALDDAISRRHHRQRQYFGGRMTLALLMIVDAIDDILNTTTNDATMTAGSPAGNADGGSGGASMQDVFTRPTIPSLHRPGLHQRHAPSGTRGVDTTSEEATVVGGGYHHQGGSSMIMMGEELSLTMAWEFLSRLLLILAF